MPRKRLSDEELAEVRRAHKVRPEDIGPTPLDKRRVPSDKKGNEPPEWLQDGPRK